MVIAHPFPRLRCSFGSQSLRGILKPLLVALSFLLLAQSALAQPAVVSVSLSPDRKVVAPGGTVVLAYTFEHKPGWHIHTNDPIVPAELGDFEPIPTSLTIKSKDGSSNFIVGTLQWPKPITIDFKIGDKVGKYGVFDELAVVFIPIFISDQASGELTLDVFAEYQACNDKTCLAPEESTESVTLTIDPKASLLPDPQNPLLAGLDSAILKLPTSQPSGLQGEKSTAATSGSQQNSNSSSKTLPLIGKSDRLEFQFFGTSFSIDPRGFTGMALLLLLAAAGGFLLNVMPCVLPVLPLKIASLAHAAGSKQRTLILGIAMALGVVAFWVVIGGVIAFSTSFKSASLIISTWWFATSIGVLMIVMALSLLGAFNVGVPNWAYAINPSHDTLHGSFLFGVLTAVLATPCVAPLAATAMGWAAFQPAATTLLVFGAIGAGMAIPYLLLAANPAWISRVPRAGPASELMKQVMALFMFAVAAFFIGVGLLSLNASQPHIGGVLHWWFVAVLTAVASFWMILRLFQIRVNFVPRTFFTLLGIGMTLTSLMFARYQTRIAKESYIPPDPTGASMALWKNYSPDLLAASLASGKVVVTDFTAEWCLNCKAFEAILNESEVKSLLSSPDVIAIKVDLTNKVFSDGTPNPAWKYMENLQEVGPPILAIYNTQGQLQFKANSYTKQVVIDQLAQAKGAPSPTRSASK